MCRTRFEAQPDRMPHAGPVIDDEIEQVFECSHERRRARVDARLQRGEGPLLASWGCPEVPEAVTTAYESGFSWAVYDWRDVNGLPAQQDRERRSAEPQLSSEQAALIGLEALPD